MSDVSDSNPANANPMMTNYAPADLAFERGEGAYLFGTNGRRYLDFASGVAVTALGHAHPALVAAVTAQVGRVWHVSNIFTIPEQQRYADKLIAACFADRVFFCNSGAEAMEASLKLARRYHAQRGDRGRFRIVTIDGAFHGRTFATLAAGGKQAHLDGYGPPLEGFDQVAFGNLNELRAALSSATAAIVIEPVQGEGGVRPVDPEFLRALRVAADEFGSLLVFDEVQTGFGRTGKLFAYQWSGVAPDIMATAKGMAGGFPCGACLATADAAKGFTPGSHGSTFGGNPLAMAAAEATLDVLNSDGFLDHVQATAETLRRHVSDVARRHPAVLEEVRGLGMLLGMRCAPDYPCGTVATALHEHGLLTVPAAENIVRLLPPLIIDDKHVAEAVAIIDQTLTDLAAAKS